MSYGVRRCIVFSLSVAFCIACISCSARRGIGTWGVTRTGGAGPEAQDTQPEGGPSLVYGQGPRDSVPAPLAEPVRLPTELGLRDAFMLALRANKNIRVASLDADAAEEGVTGAKGEFDPEVFLEFVKGRSNTPVEGVPLGRTELSEGAFSGGIRQRVPTGTTVELRAATAYERELTGTSAIDPSYGPEVKVSVTQDLLKDLGIGINRTDILIAQNNAEISREELRNTIIDDLFSVERAYWDLYFALADLTIREERLTRANELVRRAETRAGVGSGAELDVKTARSSAAAQTVAILNARNNVTKIRRSLLKLLGVLDVDTAQTDFQLIDAPAQEIVQMTLADAVETAQTARPDYVQAELEIDNSALRERFARNQRLPTLQLFGEYGLVGLGGDFGSSVDVLDDGDFDNWQAGLRFEVPIPNRTAGAGHRTAQIGRERAKVQLEALAETITRDVADALADLRTADDRIATAIGARTLAEDVLRMRTKDLDVRGLDNLEVLRAQESLASAQRDVIRAQADYATALANLYRVQGVLLGKRGIAFVPRADQR